MIIKSATFDVQSDGFDIKYAGFNDNCSGLIIQSATFDIQFDDFNVHSPILFWQFYSNYQISVLSKNKKTLNYGKEKCKNTHSYQSNRPA